MVESTSYIKRICIQDLENISKIDVSPLVGEF